VGGLIGGMAACRSVRNIFRVRLLIGNTNSKIYIYTAPEFCQGLVFACETVPVILWRGQSLKVFGNRVLEKVCRHKNDVTTKELRKLHEK
jgi:hypothetical protein